MLTAQSTRGLQGIDCRAAGGLQRIAALRIARLTLKK
jgi:hypothetical protein